MTKREDVILSRSIFKDFWYGMTYDLTRKSDPYLPTARRTRLTYYINAPVESTFIIF